MKLKAQLMTTASDKSLRVYRPGRCESLYESIRVSSGQVSAMFFTQSVAALFLRVCVCVCVHVSIKCFDVSA